MEDQVSKELEKMENEKSLKMLEQVAARALFAKGQLSELMEMGIELRVVVNTETDNEKDSIEIGPADCRFKAYMDLDDPEKCKQKLATIQALAEEADRLGLRAPPKAPKMTKGGI